MERAKGSGSYQFRQWHSLCRSTSAKRFRGLSPFLVSRSRYLILSTGRRSSIARRRYPGLETTNVYDSTDGVTSSPGFRSRCSSSCQVQTSISQCHRARKIGGLSLIQCEGPREVKSRLPATANCRIGSAFNVMGGISARVLQREEKKNHTQANRWQDGDHFAQMC